LAEYKKFNSFETTDVFLKQYKKVFWKFSTLHKETFRGFCEIFKSSIKEVDSFEVWDERSIILVFLNLKFSAIGLEFIFAKHLMSLGFSEQLPLSWHFSLLFAQNVVLSWVNFLYLLSQGLAEKNVNPNVLLLFQRHFVD
jgi:hypothetical protein